MTATFWSNTIWYILLAILTLIELLIALKKAKNRLRLVALFFFISGMTFSIEVIIYCFFRSYDYYPMIIPHSPIDDGLAGNLFSQFSITSTALLIVVFNLKYYWFLIFAGIYGIIEALFLKLHIYSHNWYRTWMTVVGTPILFAAWKRISKSNSIFTGHILRYISMFFGLYTLHMILLWWPLLLSGFVGINLKLLPDSMTSYTFVSFLNLFFLTNICMYIYFSKLKWWVKSIALLILYSIIYFAKNFNVIYIPKGGLFVIATLDIFGMLLFVYLLDKLFSKVAK